MITSRSVANFARLGMMFVGLLWFGVLAVRATDRYVATNGTDGGACTNWATAASNIQFAVDLATNVDDTVWVSNGVYLVTNQIAITKKITVKGLNGYFNTLVYADSAQTNIRCFYVANTGVVDGITISNGHINYVAGDYTGGGGAYVATNGIIQNCYFVNNTASNQGALYFYQGGGGANVHGNGLISNCLFVGNRAAQGAGAPWHYGVGGAVLLNSGRVLDSIMISNYAQGNGAAIRSINGSDIISNCFASYNTSANLSGVVSIDANGAKLLNSVISNNTGNTYGAGVAGGGIVRDCTIVNNNGGLRAGGMEIGGGGYVSNCIIAYNKATTAGAQGGGGGVYISPGTANNTMMDSCFIFNNVCGAGNFGYGGGGVSIINGSAQLRNCLIYNNTNFGSGSGGGVFLTNAALVTNKLFGLINCTIANNWSTNEGGGIATLGLSNYVANCIIAGNSSYSNKYPDVYNTGSNSNNYWYSCANVTSAPLASGQGNITNNPAFAGSGNWRLAGYSPCINAGTNQSWMTNALDLDGRIRIRYGTVDMGAYEGIYDGTITKCW